MEWFACINTMLNIFVYKKIESVPHFHLMDFYWGKNNFGLNRAGSQAIGLLNRKFFNVVDDVDSADYIMIPHSFFNIDDSNYINEVVSFSSKHNKKIIIFSYGDSDETISVPNSLIFRTSQYGYKMKENEYIIPAIADDLLGGNSLIFREKVLKSPVVGFCGWASLGGPYRALKEYIKLVVGLMRGICDNHAIVHRRGIIFRMDVIKRLKNSNLIVPNFVIRKSFSGNEKTIELDPAVARREYIQNIKESDLYLAIKGDGNFSIRFYETLSLGRIPVLVDTDCVLPLEDKISYKDFILRIDYKDIKNIDKKIKDFYDKLSNEDFVLMQKKAREAFHNYLRIDKYFEYLFLNPDSILYKK